MSKIQNGIFRAEKEGTISQKDIEKKYEKMNPRIEMNPEIMLGKPVIKGTRITVELILRKLSQGAQDKEILDAYPHITMEDIHAALSHAADVLAHQETVQSEPPKPTRKK